MSRAIFRMSLFVGLLVLMFTTVVFFFLRYSQAQDETYAALQQEAAYAEQGLLHGGEDYLRALGSVNLRAVEEYAAAKARYDELQTQQEDLRRAEADLRELIR